MAVKKSAGVAAVRTEVTRELMSPVMDAEAAADWISIARAGRMEGGMLAAISCWVAAERAGEEVLKYDQWLIRGRLQVGTRNWKLTE